MLCKKCNNEIKDGDKFCNKCGCPTENNNLTTYNDIVGKAKGIVNNSVKTISENTTARYLAVAVLMQLIVLIMRFVSFGSYSITIKSLEYTAGNTYSLNTIMGSALETFIFVTLIIASMVLCFLPIIKNDFNMKRNLLLAKIAMIYNAIIIVIGIWALVDVISRNEDYYISKYGEGYISSSWSLTFGGWLNVILTAATIILLFYISSFAKKDKK